MQGWIVAEGEHWEKGLAQMIRGLATYQAMGLKDVRPYFLALLANAHKKAGQAEAGMRVLEESLAFSSQTGLRVYEAELYRLKGETSLQAASPSPEERVPEAENCFQQAIAIARQQSAKSWELRAAMSLSRLWQQQGKKTEARDLLAPVYHWFTEGFDTADLKDAKALLADLSEGV